MLPQAAAWVRSPRARSEARATGETVWGCSGVVSSRTPKGGGAPGGYTPLKGHARLSEGAVLCPSDNECNREASTEMKRQKIARVAETDPDFARFWSVYPWRAAKQEARLAWAQMQPSAALVDRMLEALRWQVPLWTRQGWGTPYPATYLRNERWTDEPPRSGQVTDESPEQYLERIGWCSHAPRCTDSEVCRAKRAQDANRR